MCNRLSTIDIDTRPAHAIEETVKKTHDHGKTTPGRAGVAEAKAGAGARATVVKADGAGG